MPRISDVITGCSVYLYESTKGANSGSQNGGSGFLVHFPSAVSGYAHLYVVTNQHVIDNGFCVLRLNQKKGGHNSIETQPEDWIPHPSGDDIAIFPIDLGDTFKWWSVGTDLFITQEIIATYRIGLGDEAFFIGRLITHGGKQKNAPVTRFGNIPLMADPSEPVRHNGKDQEAFLVDCRSLGGFSGSPVFVTTHQGYDGEDAQRITDFRRAAMGLERPEPGKGISARVVSMLPSTHGPWLLGIDFGHIPLWQPVYKRDKHGNKSTDYWAETNTGIAGVVPSWKIMQLLQTKKLAKERESEDRKLVKRLETENSVVPDSSKNLVSRSVLKRK